MATLFPPWRYSYSSSGFGLPRLPGLSGSRSYSSSYGFLFKPPSESATIELSRLVVEWALIAFVTGGLVFWFRKSKSAERETKPELVSISRAKWRLVVSLVVFIAAAVLGLGYYGYATRKKLSRLEATIQNAKNILDSELSKEAFVAPAPRRFYPILEPPPGAIPIAGPIPVAPVGKLTPIVYTLEQAQQLVQAEYERVRQPMTQNILEKLGVLEHVREELGKPN